MTADLRGFVYALEPLLRRQRWELEALRARLGAANREIAGAVQALDTLQVQLTQQSASAAGAVTQRVDPAMHRRSLQWLARLREGIAQASQALQALRDRRAQLMAEHAQRQNRLDVIERHRAERLAGYALEHQNREAAQADREWLARQPAAAQAAVVTLGGRA